MPEATQQSYGELGPDPIPGLKPFTDRMRVFSTRAHPLGSRVSCWTTQRPRKLWYLVFLRIYPALTGQLSPPLPSQTRKWLWEVAGFVAWPEASPRAVPFLHLPLISACRGQAAEACCHLKASLPSEAGDAHLGGIQTSPSLQWLSCILVCILNTPSIPDFTWLKLGADKKTQSA